MAEPHNLLIYELSYRRLSERIEAIAPGLRVSVMDAQGRITVDGMHVPSEDARATIGWPNLDIFVAECRREYFRALLKSTTMYWVQSAAAGVDDPVFARLAAKGIVLTNSDAQAPAIADFVLGAALDFFQEGDERRRLQSGRLWQRLAFREIADTSWLIVGYGHIGRETARRAHAFGARIVGVRRRPQSDEFAAQVVAQDQLMRFLPDADVVVLSCALNAATRNLANAGFFARMKPQSLLVNIGRGGLVEEQALVAALERDAPRRAVLDVFQVEPLPMESPLWAHPQIRISAHTSNHGSGNTRRGDELFLDNLGRFVRGEALRNRVAAGDLANIQPC
jgi:phosphoglycerate dehydrogenase-like enzyme